MILEDLTLGELLSLSRHAEDMCLRRLGQIRSGSDPLDAPLHDLLDQLSAEVRNHRGAVKEYLGRLDEAAELASPDAERQVLWRLPSLARGFGEGYLDRDLALFFAESMEEEASRFYRALSEHAPNAESRSFFVNMAERDRCSLHLLREVVLQG